jgi:hypothetical protein
MTKIIDLFGHDTRAVPERGWKRVVAEQHCPFVDRKCYKIRKSQPEISIGTCSVEHKGGPIIICPQRLLELRQIFTDCLHLLTGHEPGNELHIVAEIGVPGGSIDYFIASIRDDKVRDFVGIELQTLDTTGIVWPERQRFVQKHGVAVDPKDVANKSRYGINWKMTAKTILIQLHHKIQTFEGVGKHLVLVIQDRLLDYMSREFSFAHLNSARLSDPLHFHAYTLDKAASGLRLNLTKRLSTDTEGIAKCLGRQPEAKLELDVILRLIEQRISHRTRFELMRAPPPISVEADE